MTETEIKDMLKDIIDNGAEYEFRWLRTDGWSNWKPYKLGKEILCNDSRYEYRKVEKWYVIHEGKTENGDIVYCRQSTFEKYYTSLNKEIFFKGTEEECKQWIEEHTKKTWLEETCEQRMKYEKDYIHKESKHIYNSTRYGIVEVCKKILEEMDKTSKERQIRHERFFPLNFQKRDIEQIILHLGVEL